MESIVTLSQEEKNYLDKSIKVINKHIDFFVIRFYHYFLSTDAGNLFQNTQMDKQMNMFATSLIVIFNHVKNPFQLKSYLEELAIRHRNYGVITEHSDYFIDSFMAAIKEVMEGENLGNKTLDLWFKIISDVLGFFQDIIDSN